MFDIVTTIGHWVHWASVCRAVGGVTERPIQLGEPIYEFIHTPTGPQEVVWHITEHDRPRRMKLEVEDGTRLKVGEREREGDGGEHPLARAEGLRQAIGSPIAQPGKELAPLPVPARSPLRPPPARPGGPELRPTRSPA